MTTTYHVHFIRSSKPVYSPMNTLLWPSTHCILAAAGWLKTAPWSSRSPRPTTMLRRWSPRSSTSARRASEPRYSLRQLETRIKRVSTRTRTFGDYLYEIEKSNRCYIQNSGNKKVSTCCAEEEDFFDVKTKILVNLCLFWKLFEIVNKKQAQQSRAADSLIFNGFPLLRLLCDLLSFDSLFWLGRN